MEDLNIVSSEVYLPDMQWPGRHSEHWIFVLTAWTPRNVLMNSPGADAVFSPQKWEIYLYYVLGVRSGSDGNNAVGWIPETWGLLENIFPSIFHIIHTFVL